MRATNLKHPKITLTKRIAHGFGLRASVLVMTLGLGAACGSRKNEDIDSVTPATQGSNVAFKAASGTQDQSAGEVGCEAVLKQTYRFKEQGVEATFEGAVDKTRCEGEGKKPILYIRSGDANFAPPVELDCQPKAQGAYGTRCVNAGPVISAKGIVRIVITADSNYRSSQTGMMITYE